MFCSHGSDEGMEWFYLSVQKSQNVPTMLSFSSTWLEWCLRRVIKARQIRVFLVIFARAVKRNVLSIFVNHKLFWVLLQTIRHMMLGHLRMESCDMQ